MMITCGIEEQQWNVSGVNHLIQKGKLEGFQVSRGRRGGFDVFSGNNTNLHSCSHFVPGLAVNRLIISTQFEELVSLPHFGCL